MAEPLKNMYNQRFFDVLTGALHNVYPAFDRDAFRRMIFDDQWEERELKSRMRHITHTLHALLPAEYRTALNILRKAAPQLEGFGYEPIIFPDFVEVYGVGDWEASLPALEQFTQQSSGEFAVRQFILQDQDRMMAQMLAWSQHENHHVRRLASEGCRPRLPWAVAFPRLKADPSPILPILENLKSDESEYVRRSVANNLNDIAKDNPQVVLDVVRGWRQHETHEMAWVINHALRTLIKQGNREALGLLGYGGETAFEMSDFTVTPEVIPMGGEVIFSFKVESQSQVAQELLVDYVVYHQRANGKQTPKVFKLSKYTLGAGEIVTVSKKHSFRPVTTRRYYPGEHAIEIQINGVPCGRKMFEIK